MKESNFQYERLSTRDGFNSSVVHIQSAIDVVGSIEKKQNVADVLLDLLQEKQITQDQLPSFVSMLLGDKFKYVNASKNLVSPVQDLSAVADICAKIFICDLVMSYHHPDMGFLALNPKNLVQMDGLSQLAKYEFVTIWAGNFGKASSQSAKAVCEYVINLLEGSKDKPLPSWQKGDCSYRQPAKVSKNAKSRNAKPQTPPKAGKKAPGRKAAGTDVAAQIAAKAAGYSAQGQFVQAQGPVAVEVPVPRVGMRMTPKYAVLVTNELFHNGNVEAWKRIIDSFKTKHPDLEVMVYYDNERITNLNSLFTWGKVKRGTCIEFAVAGENIVDVAKLQRYLRQGASHMFEAFLKGSVNNVLQLF